MSLSTFVQPLTKWDGGKCIHDYVKSYQLFQKQDTYSSVTKNVRVYQYKN